MLIGKLFWYFSSSFLVQGEKRKRKKKTYTSTTTTTVINKSHLTINVGVQCLVSAVWTNLPVARKSKFKTPPRQQWRPMWLRLTLAPTTRWQTSEIASSQAVAEQTTSVHTTAAQRKGKYSCLDPDDALPELSLSSASIFVEDDVSMCTQGKRCAVLTWGRPELHGLCVFVFHIPKAVPSVMQRRVFFTDFWEWLTVRDTIEWSADQTRLRLFLLS